MKTNSISAIIGDLLLIAMAASDQKSSSTVLPHRVGKDERMPITIDRWHLISFKALS